MILKKVYELAVLIFKATKLFPKSQRFLMADSLKETVIGILEQIIQVNTAKEKASFLENMSLGRIRIMICPKYVFKRRATCSEVETTL